MSETPQQNTIRPDNWKHGAPTPPEGTPTFSRQSVLPRLPLPSLANTLNKLKASLKPLARSNEEWDELSQCLEAFGEASGIGRLLHRRLEERSKRVGVDHWLEEFWDDVSTRN